MPRDRFGKLLAALDIGLDLEQDLAELLVLHLVGDSFKCRANRDACADHDRELSGEVENVLL